MKQNRGFAAIWGLIIVAVVLVGGIVYLNMKYSADESGSTTPPPAGTLPPPTGSTIDDFSVQFPNVRSEGNYFTQDWKMKVESKSFSCVEQAATTPGDTGVYSVTTNNRNYCFYYVSGGGAAGTSYGEYKYVGERYGKLISISFTLGMINCGVYDNPRKSVCESEQKKLNLESIIDQVFLSIQSKDSTSAL